MRSEVIEAINTLCEELHDRYSLNAGGCCYCASVLARELEALGIKYKLVIYDYDTKGASSLAVRRNIKNRNKLSDYSDIMFCGSHYAIMLSSGELLNASEYHGNYPYMTVGCLNSKHIKWMYDEGDWNMRYDPKYNSIVAKRVKQLFKQYAEL